MSEDNHCSFCNIKQVSSHPHNIAKNDVSFVIHDSYSVTQGHGLVTPKHYIDSFYKYLEGGNEFLLGLFELVKVQLDGEFQLAGYNIGNKDGLASEKFDYWSWH